MSESTSPKQRAFRLLETVWGDSIVTRKRPESATVQVMFRDKTGEQLFAYGFSVEDFHRFALDVRSVDDAIRNAAARAEATR